MFVLIFLLSLNANAINSIEAANCPDVNEPSFVQFYNEVEYGQRRLGESQFVVLDLGLESLEAERSKMLTQFENCQQLKAWTRQRQSQLMKAVIEDYKNY